MRSCYCIKMDADNKNPAHRVRSRITTKENTRERYETTTTAAATVIRTPTKPASRRWSFFFLEGKRIISEEMPRPSVSRKGSGPVDLSAGYRPDWASRCLRHTFLSLSLFSTRVCEIFPADNRRIRGMKRPLKPIVAAANLHRVKDVLSGRARSPFDARTCAMRAERSVIK